MNFYYLKDGIEYGPFSADDLRREPIDCSTDVRYENDRMFQKAEDIPEVVRVMGWRSAQATATNSTNSGGHTYSEPAPTMSNNQGPSYPRQQSQQQQQPYNANYGIPPVRPSNYKVLAFISLWVGLMPFGVLAMIYALWVDYVYDKGDYERAQRYSKKALTYSLWAFALFILFIIILLIFVLGFGAILPGILASHGQMDLF